MLRNEETPREFASTPSIRYLTDGSLMAVSRSFGGIDVVRFGPDGAVLVRRTLYPPAGAAQLAADPFGAVVILSQTSTYGGAGAFWVMKYDGATGRPMWPAPGRFAFRTGAQTSGLAINERGDVIVTGLLEDIDDYGWVTLCFDGSTGVLRWGPALYPQAGGSPRVLSVDPAGDVVVTGYAPAGAGSLWAAVKYSGASGARLWGPILLGLPNPLPPGPCPGSCFDPNNAAPAFDRQGNVLLTVSSYTDDGDLEWLIAKYDRSTGAVIWGPVKQKSGSGYDVPSRIEVDLGGDVFVAGSSGGDFVLIKYAGATGAKLWEPVSVGSSVVGLIVDGSGRVVVTGIGPSGDLRTAKFRGNDGTVLWASLLGPEILAPGPPQVSPSADGLAVASNGDLTVAVAVFYPVFEQRVVRYSGETGSPVWGPTTVLLRGSLNFPVAALPDGHGATLLVSDGGERPGSVIKYDSVGGVAWGPIDLSPLTKTYGWPMAAAVDPSADFLIGGSTVDTQSHSWFLAKYSGAAGALVWGPVPLNHSLRSIATGPTGDVLTLQTLDSGWALSKYSGSSGSLLWGPTEYNPPGYSAPIGLAVDRSGNAYVTGFWSSDGSNAVWVTSKYAGSNGISMWGPVSLPNTSYGLASPAALAVDSRGDLVVTGRVVFGWTTIKYSGASGTVLWGPRQLRDDGYGSPASLALDADDNLVISGEIYDFSRLNPIAMAIIKYNGTTGQTQWGPLSLDTSLSSVPPLIATSSSGDVIVAATTFNGTDDDWAILRYAGTTGEVLEGPEIYDAGGYEDVQSVFTDGSDFVVVGTAQGGVRTVRYTENLAIRTLQKDLPPARCGTGYSQTLQANNGAMAVSWSVAAGDLPSGMNLDPFSGLVSGSPSGEGSFAFTVRVEGSNGRLAEREFSLDVLDGDSDLVIAAVPDQGCPEGGFGLSVPGQFTSYSWQPGGEAAPSIHVCPTNPTLYSVVVTDGEGCQRRGAVLLEPYRIGLVPRPPLGRPVKASPRSVTVAPRPTP